MLKLMLPIGTYTPSTKQDGSVVQLDDYRGDSNT